jgi:hypothetical protein
MKKLVLCVVLALTLPVALLAQAAQVDNGSLTPKQLAAVLAAVAKTHPTSPIQGQLIATASGTAPAAGTPAIIPGIVTVGAALATFGQFQPAPCFGCLVTTASPNTFGIALPVGVVPSGNPILQFVETFDNQTYNGFVTLSLVVLNGDKVLSVGAVSGFIYPAIWCVYYLQNTPSITGSKLTAAAVITSGVNGQINQVKSIPFWVQ